MENTFFANDILFCPGMGVHSSTTVRTESHPDGIEIKDLYDEQADSSIQDKILSVTTDDSGQIVTAYIPFKSVERQSVDSSTAKWTVAAQSGRNVTGTAEMQFMVYASLDKKRWIVNPQGVKDYDLLTIYNHETKELQLADIRVMERKDVPFADDEYVYSIEFEQ